MKPNPAQLPSEHLKRKRNAMVQAILETARAIMREEGVAALSMHELARRLDLRAPSLYHYFSSKMNLYDALFRSGILLLRERSEKAYHDAHTWQEYFTRSFETYLSFAKENPDLYQLCFERPVPGFVPSEESLRISFDYLYQFYQQAAAFKDTMRTDLSEQQVVDLIIAVMHGITAMHLANEPELPIGQGRFGSLIPAALAIFEKAWS